MSSPTTAAVIVVTTSGVNCPPSARRTAAAKIDKKTMTSFGSGGAWRAGILGTGSSLVGIPSKRRPDHVTERDGVLLLF